jgi:hypothetical protein
LTFIHNTDDFTELVFVNIFFDFDTFWEMWIWVPLTVHACVVSSDWDKSREFKTFITGWEAPKLAVGVFAFNLSIYWSGNVRTFSFS